MEMQKKMKKVGFHMNILMGFSLSFCLSLTNTLQAEKPTLNVWLMSFGVSAVISFALSFLMPMKKAEDKVVGALGLTENRCASRLVSTAVSDFIYTPVITLAMVLLVRYLVMQESHGMAQLPPFPIMFIKSFIVSFIVAYCIIYLINRPMLKVVLKMNGISPELIDNPEKIAEKN